MQKTIQIHDVDDEVYVGLARRAAEDGATVPELLRAAAAPLATPDGRHPAIRSNRRDRTVRAFSVCAR